MDPLGKLTKKADATAENAAALVAKAIRGIRAELALLAEELNIAGSAKDRDKAYAMIQSKMAELSKRLDRLMRSQLELAGKTAAKSASEMTGIEVKFSAKRARAIMELVTPAQGENLAAVFTQNMAQRSINALQDATVAVMREQAVEGGTLKEMGKALGKRWTDALKAPPVFTDAGNHTWDTQTYLQMNIRTNTTRVYNDCLVDDIARSTGEDFVRVSRGGDPMCKLCAPWEGVILSISGKAKGFPSYEQARAAGCFHPNCVHTLEYTDEVADEEEFEIQRKFPATEKEATDPDAMDERRYKIDQERYRRKGLTNDAARIAVDRDNLTDNIRHGLVRGDAREIVDKLTDAQITALCKDGNPPRFTPTKKATKKDPHAADEKFIRGKRGGVVHIKRDAGVEDLVRVARLEEAKQPIIASPNTDNTLPDGRKLADSYRTKTYHITEESNPKALAKAIDDVGKRIRDFDVEHMVVLNPDGTPRFDEFISTPIGGPIPNQWKGNLKGATLIHNHPGLEGSLSHDDVFCSCAEGITSIYAFSKKRRYSLVVEKWPPIERLNEVWNAAEDYVQEKLRDLPAIEKMKRVHDEILRHVAKKLKLRYNNTEK